MLQWGRGGISFSCHHLGWCHSCFWLTVPRKSPTILLSIAKHWRYHSFVWSNRSVTINIPGFAKSMWVHCCIDRINDGLVLTWQSGACLNKEVILSAYEISWYRYKTVRIRSWNMHSMSCYVLTVVSPIIFKLSTEHEIIIITILCKFQND